MDKSHGAKFQWLFLTAYTYTPRQKSHTDGEHTISQTCVPLFVTV
jgi:hypothetical protein